MIRRKDIFLIPFFLLFAADILFAQVTLQEAKEKTEQFFSLCKKGDFQNSAKLLAYFGPDKSRLYKDFFNPNNPDEFKEVKRICKKINATLLISDSYSFGKLRNKKIDGKIFQSLDVEFKSGNQKIRKKILFLKLNNKLAIFDYS